jgi:hypothetical protein
MPKFLVFAMYAGLMFSAYGAAAAETEVGVLEQPLPSNPCLIEKQAPTPGQIWEKMRGFCNRGADGEYLSRRVFTIIVICKDMGETCLPSGPQADRICAKLTSDYQSGTAVVDTIGMPPPNPIPAKLPADIYCPGKAERDLPVAPQSDIPNVR